jgi:hypothetical protein
VSAYFLVYIFLLCCCYDVRGRMMCVDEKIVGVGWEKLQAQMDCTKDTKTVLKIPHLGLFENLVTTFDLSTL